MTPEEAATLVHGERIVIVRDGSATDGFVSGVWDGTHINMLAYVYGADELTYDDTDQTVRISEKLDDWDFAYWIDIACIERPRLDLDLRNHKELEAWLTS